MEGKSTAHLVKRSWVFQGVLNLRSDSPVQVVKSKLELLSNLLCYEQKCSMAAKQAFGGSHPPFEVLLQGRSMISTQCSISKPALSQSSQHRSTWHRMSKIQAWGTLSLFTTS